MKLFVLTILQWILKKLNAVKYGSLDGKYFEFEALLTRPIKSKWPPLCKKYKYLLLKPLCIINNKILLNKQKI